MRTSIIILALMALMATACGGSDDTADTAADAVADAADSAGDAADDAAADLDVDTSGLADNCQDIANAFTSVPSALTGGTGDATAVRAEAEAFAEVASDVPDEYAADFQLFADYFEQIADAVESGDVNDLAALGTTASSADFQTASTNLATFFSNGCE